MDAVGSRTGQGSAAVHGAELHKPRAGPAVLDVPGLQPVGRKWVEEERVVVLQGAGGRWGALDPCGPANTGWVRDLGQLLWRYLIGKPRAPVLLALRTTGSASE